MVLAGIKLNPCHQSSLQKQIITIIVEYPTASTEGTYF